MRELKTIELNWDEVSQKIQDMLKNILGINICCETTQDDYDFWGVKFYGYRLNIDEINKICNYINATDEEKEDIYPEDAKTIGDFGVNVANKLLSISIGFEFESFLICRNYLYLIDCKEI